MNPLPTTVHGILEACAKADPAGLEIHRTDLAKLEREAFFALGRSTDEAIRKGWVTRNAETSKWLRPVTLQITETGRAELQRLMGGER